MLVISKNICLDDTEFELTAIRAQGSGGQNVNKVATAIHLRFDINTSSLPDFVKERLLKLSEQRITADGVIIIKAQSFRTQEKNKQDALQRLGDIIRSVLVVPKKRVPTKPSKNSQKRRMDSKTKHGRLKDSRKKIDRD